MFLHQCGRITAGTVPPAGIAAGDVGEIAPALIHDQRKILDVTATGRLPFREFIGPIVYCTHLMSHRCAIREVRIGVDTAVPDRVLPPRHEEFRRNSL